MGGLDGLPSCWTTDMSAALFQKAAMCIDSLSILTSFVIINMAN